MFIVEPLERGYGTTLGNSLRRVLLASLPGAAVTSINIEGYSTNLIPFQESVKTLCKLFLTLKESPLNLTSKTKKIIELDVEGPAEVTAGDILTDSDIEIVNLIIIYLQSEKEHL